jgi:hypothetical protein
MSKPRCVCFLHVCVRLSARVDKNFCRGQELLPTLTHIVVVRIQEAHCRFGDFAVSEIEERVSESSRPTPET